MTPMRAIVAVASVIVGCVLLVASCTSSRYTSTTTLDFVLVDTTKASGPTVVPVYQNYQLGAERPQHFLPLERPDPSRAGTIREIVTIRTSRPFLERSDVDTEFYGLMMCTPQAHAPCEPERATIFFTMPWSRGFGERENRQAYREFDRRFDRRFQLSIDDVEIETQIEPLYERHGVIWELWINLPYELFRQIAAAEEVYFTFGRTDLRFRGRELRPFRAMVAAVHGAAALEEAPLGAPTSSDGNGR